VIAAQALLAENSLFKSIGSIFQPLFKLFATLLAYIYAVVPNYALAIIFLTIIVMAVLTPLTVKSTKSMMAMQRLQPEIKRLQQKYKGAENRQQLNEEMMALYKKEGINPAGGCIPVLIQMPFLIVLYDVIKGLTYTINKGSTYPAGSPHAGEKCTQALCAVPRYIPTTSKMYANLVAHPGQMNAFGMNLALKPFSHHGSWEAAVPYFALVLIAVVLQFIQMRQMTRRNPAAAQANPQMQTIQKIMPVLFAYIYFLIPAGVVLYMITSTLIRIGTQDVMFRMGITAPPAERAIPGAGGKASGGGGPKTGGSSAKVDKPGGSNGSASKALPVPEDDVTTNGGSTTNGGGTNGGGKAPVKSTGGGSSAKASSGSTSKTGSSGRNGGSGGQASSSNGGANGANGEGATSGTAPKSHPRSKAKRARKAR